MDEHRSADDWSPASWQSKPARQMPVYADAGRLTYPVPPEQLRAVLLEYPRLIFVGAEHGNTLFGLVPYLFVAGVVVKAAASRVPGLVARAPRIAFDRLDVWLLCSCLVFFGLLNFFPNNFTFDLYYSVPRIFRYLTPLSYGLSLLAAKLLLDAGDLVPGRFGMRWISALAVLLAPAHGIVDAVAPGRSHHSRVAAIREDLRAICPPMALFERRAFRPASVCTVAAQAVPGTLRGGPVHAGPGGCPPVPSRSPATSDRPPQARPCA